ncbi:MAG TPA: hypothetical protein IAC40_04855 [Candidatus Faecivivens stercorigallinarum]|nr:hypothetical protein [Candidatus Faecivivens stercorigallinarum]
MYLTIPEFVYIVLLCGGIALLVVSVLMGIRGMIKKRGKRYFVTWCIVLLVSLVAVVLTTTGVLVANTMLGG